MTPEAKSEREAQIAEAAYAVLAEKGFAGLSMLAVAKRAKASNETLYRWYGDKTGLLRALIARDAAELAEALDMLLMRGGDAAQTLDAVGACLLDKLLSARSVALIRAAAADSGDSLGIALKAAGQESLMPRLVPLFVRLKARGRVRSPAAKAAELWIDVLLGDWVLRGVTGAMGPPDASARAARIGRAAEIVLVQPAR